jgi:hypothetical protein
MLDILNWTNFNGIQDSKNREELVKKVLKQDQDFEHMFVKLRTPPIWCSFTQKGKRSDACLWKQLQAEVRLLKVEQFKTL